VDKLYDSINNGDNAKFKNNLTNNIALPEGALPLTSPNSSLK
jgi:hypothetical protein